LFGKTTKKQKKYWYLVKSVLILKHEKEMSTMRTRLREARRAADLSQEAVANETGLTRTAISAIEKGTRKVTADELIMFSRLYGISVDILANGPSPEEDPDQIFVESFADLSEIDKKEIMHMIKFKRARKEGKEHTIVYPKYPKL